MAIDTKGKIKYKGAFEIIDSGVDDFKEWHKEPSFTIVSRAISNYFVHGIAIESTINSCDDILEFIGRAKFKSDSIGEVRGYVQVNDQLLEYSERQQKTTRYYVSNTGTRLVKIYENGNEAGVNSGYLVTIYNNHVARPISTYDLNRKFYIEQAYKIISKVEGNKSQLSLF